VRTSPTQRSLKRLREDGYIAQVVERWNSFAHIRQDLFGWIDIVAVHPERPGVLGVQTTTAANAMARLEKAQGNPALLAWLKGGSPLAIHGWAKRGPRGQPKVWTVKVIDLNVDMITKKGETDGADAQPRPVQ